MTRNITHKCTKCGKQLKRKDYKKLAVILYLNCVFLTPILMFITHGLVVPILNFVISLVAGTDFILKKNRYIYVCKDCGTRYAGDEFEPKKPMKD